MYSFHRDQHGRHTCNDALLVLEAFGHAAVVLVAVAKVLGALVHAIFASAGVAAVAPIIAGVVARAREGVGAALLAGLRNGLC